MTSSKFINLSRRLAQCGRSSNSRLGASLHAIVVKSTNANYDTLVVWNSLVSMYSKCGELNHAATLFDEMPARDSVSWNSLLLGCSVKKDYFLAFEYFNKMRQSSDCLCDPATLTTILTCCEEIELLFACEMIHALAFKHGFYSLVPVGNAIISTYSQCRSPGNAHKVFDDMPERNLITWTAMISGLTQNQLFKESLVLFQDMQTYEKANHMTYSSILTSCSKSMALKEGKQIHGLIVKSGFKLYPRVQSALMDMYSKCNSMLEALQVFDSCKEIDRVLGTMILVGLAHNGFEKKAFEFFAELVKLRVQIDMNMVSAILGAFGSHAPFTLGKQIHALVIKNNFISNIYICNGLVNMYSKCGEMNDAFKVFEEMASRRNLVSWNSIILAYARNGHASKVFELYEWMTNEGIKPSDITFLSLLNACSHEGLYQKGVELFDSMILKYRIAPRVEHYACIVDLLGRAGHLNEAKEYIENLNIECKVLLWQTLIGSCNIHGDIEMRDKIIMNMNNLGMKKITGISWIDD